MTKDVVITSVPQSVPGEGTQCVWIAEALTKETILGNTPNFPARIPTPSRLNLYEVRPTPDMGLGLFAKSDIKRGEVILAERPLLVAPFGMEVPNFNLPTEQVLELGITGFKSSLEAAFARLSPESQGAFKALHNECPEDHLLGLTFTNAYAVNLYPFSPLSMVVCKVGSRINHSCTPNAQFTFQPNSFAMQLHAGRNIKTGDQLLVSYGYSSSDFAERRENLAPYGIVCKCPACVNVTPRADQLRRHAGETINFNSERSAAYNPFTIDQTMLEKALMLEKDMIEEGTRD